MEQQILDVLEAYVKTLEDGKISEKVLSEVHRSIPSFERLAKNCGYIMTPSVDGEGTLVVQFSSEAGNIYTTYTFLNVLTR